jgi:catechol 2,3-dioxygenase-like lactoylglutathione lyase family enzyme
MLKFVCPLIVVDDLAVSRRFYEDVLDQRVKNDHGEDVVFEGDFAIHLRSHFRRLLGEDEGAPVKARAHDHELYSETDELDAVQTRLATAGVELVHPIHVEPWGQRTLRCEDPDGHLVEVGEPMTAADVSGAASREP